MAYNISLKLLTFDKYEGKLRKHYSVFHSQKNPMGLTVALSDTLFAEGQLYWDDGVHIGMYDASCLHKILFCCEDG